MSFVIGTTFEIRRRLLWDKVTRVFRDIDRLVKLSVYLFTELFISVRISIFKLQSWMNQ